MNSVCSYKTHTHTHTHTRTHARAHTHTYPTQTLIFIYIEIKFPTSSRACLQQLLKISSQSDERCVLLYGTHTHTHTHTQIAYTDMDFYIYMGWFFSFGTNASVLCCNNVGRCHFYRRLMTCIPSLRAHDLDRPRHRSCAVAPVR